MLIKTAILWPIISVTTSASYFVYLSYVLKSKKAKPEFALIASHLSAALLLLPFIEFSNLNTASIGNYYTLFLTIFFLILSRQLYYYAYANAEVAEVTVFSALTPVYTLFSALILTGEWPETHKLNGLILITFGVYTLFIPEIKKDNLSNFLLSFAQPFIKIFKKKALACAFFSTIPTAFAAVWQKQLITIFGSFDTAFSLLFFIGSICLVITIFKYGLKNIKSEFQSLPLHFWPISALLFGSNHLVFCFLMQNETAAISLVIQRSSIMLQIILAYFFLKEDSNIHKKLIVASIILLGFTVLLMPI